MTDSYTGEQQLHTVRRQLLLSWILMLLLAVLLLLPSLRLWFGFGVRGESRTITPRGALADFEQTTVTLFRETSPSVVFIDTQARLANPWTRRIQEVETGTGSGFVWDEAGHIVTNFHVIENATLMQVVFADQSSYDAELVGKSPDNDLAVLKIDAPSGYLRPVLIGESHDLSVGQSVFAIGNPFGLQQTLTTGVVSAKSRIIQSPSGRTIEDVIQIDAAINPGNSGGPLLDSAGRLIGVNTAIYSPSGTSAGVGFAIPVDTVNRVVPEIIRAGIYEPPKLGIEVYDPVSFAISETVGIEGIVILDVVPGGPADQAGLRVTKIARNRSVRLGDIILEVDGHTVRTVNDLQNALQRHKAGEQIALLVFRDGNQLQLEVTL